MKQCKNCGDTKERHEFAKCSKANGARPTNWCKKCSNARSRVTNQKLRDKAYEEAEKKRNEILAIVREACRTSGSAK